LTRSVYELHITVKWHHLSSTQNMGTKYVHEHKEQRRSSGNRCPFRKRLYESNRPSRNTSESPRLGLSQLSHDIASASPQLSYHCCNCGIFIGCSLFSVGRPAFATATGVARHVSRKRCYGHQHVASR